MALARWQRTVVDATGVPVVGATVRVEREITGTPLATLYEDRDGTTIHSEGNPITTDANGNVGFYVTGGAFKITITGTNFSQTLRYEPIGLSQESDGVAPGVPYLFNTSTADADPGSGYISFNNSTLASVTELYVSGTNVNSVDVQGFLGSISSGKIYIRAATGSAFLIVTVTGAGTDEGDHYSFPVTVVDSGGTFIGDANVGFLSVADGADGSNGTNGVDGVNAGLKFTFDSSIDTASDPGTGDVRLNNATLSSVTEIGIDDNSAETGNPDISAFVATFADSTNSTVKGHITIKKISAPENFAVYTVSSVADATTHNRVTVSYVASSGSFSNTDEISLEFVRTGNKGADGAGSGDVSGPGTDTVVDGQIAVFNGTTGQAIEGGLDPNGSPQDPITASSLIVKQGGATITNGAILKGDADGKAQPGISEDKLKIAEIVFVIDGGGSAITTGVKGYIPIDFPCTILECTMLADQTGSIVVDIWKDTYANHPPTDADSITASAVPTISSGTKDNDTTLTGWTTDITEGDILGFNVDSATTVTLVTITLKVRKT